MSLETIAAIKDYTGNGSSATPYPIPFKFLAPDHIKVSVVNDGGIETQLGFDRYSVTQFPSGKGEVRTTEPWDATHTIVITRATPTLQPVSLEDGALIPAKTLERAFDRLAMIAQETRGYTAKQEIGLHSVTHAANGDDAVHISLDQVNDLVETLEAKASAAVLAEHLANHSNPHQVTRETLGLGNVNNTSDAAKPVSTATQTELNGKVPLARVVHTAGLASGGGDLSADVTITVAAATQAEAEAGTAGDRVMTPLGVAQAALTMRLITKTANHTLVAGDGDGRTLIDMDGSGAMTLTIPPSVLPQMRTIAVRQKGTGVVTFVAGSGVTIQSLDGLLSTAGQHSGAALIQVAANVWWLVGPLA